MHTCTYTYERTNSWLWSYEENEAYFYPSRMICEASAHTRGVTVSSWLAKPRLLAIIWSSFLCVCPEIVVYCVYMYGYKIHIMNIFYSSETPKLCHPDIWASCLEWIFNLFGLRKQEMTKHSVRTQLKELKLGFGHAQHDDTCVFCSQTYIIWNIKPPRLSGRPCSHCFSNAVPSNNGTSLHNLRTSPGFNQLLLRPWWSCLSVSRSRLCTHVTYSSKHCHFTLLRRGRQKDEVISRRWDTYNLWQKNSAI